MSDQLYDVVFSCFTAANNLLSKIETARASKPMNEILPNVVNGLNNVLFPAMRQQIAPHQALLGQPGINSEALKKISALIEVNVDAKSALKTLKTVRDMAAFPVQATVRKNKIAAAKATCEELGIMPPVASDGRFFNIAGGSEYPDQQKSVILFSPPNVKITGDDGAITRDNQLLWQGQLLLLAIDRTSHTYEISSTPALSGQFINGQQVVTFSARSGGNPATITRQGEWPVKSAWILKDANRAPSLKPSERKESHITRTFQNRAAIVQGDAITYKAAIGASPVINAESAAPIAPQITASRHAA